MVCLVGAHQFSRSWVFYMHNKNIKKLLGVELPIIQSPMAGVQGSELAIAVIEAGGLGSLPCGMLCIEDIVSEVETIRAATNKPYNLNFFCHKTPEYDVARQLKWREQLMPYFAELDVDVKGLTKNSNRVPFNHDTADAIEPFVPEVISFHFGLPDKELLARVKKWGTKVFSSATTIAEALWLESKGVDGIIVQGVEAGGHRGMFLSSDISTQVGLAALLPQVCNKVRVPVIAAGGIGSNEGVKTALSLGACAAQIGTAYLLCPEVKLSKLHSLAIQSHRSEHTAITNIFSGRPARGIVNRAMQELGYISIIVPEFPYASIEMSELRCHAEKLGVDDFSPLWCGQNTLGCKQISAGELTLLLAGKK